MRERVIDLDGPAENSPPPGDPIPPSLRQMDLLTEAVRAIYIGCRRELTGAVDYGVNPMPQWDGGEDQFGVVRSAIWPRIASVIVRLEADPIEFIRAQFWAKRDEKTPKPNYLLSPEAATRWEEYRSKAQRDIKNQLNSDYHAVNTLFYSLTSILKWADDRALRYALLDTVRVNASALYRCCLATAGGFDDIVSIFWDRAVLQYVFQQRLYDEIWGDFVPGSLQMEANQLRSRLALQ